MNDAHEIKSNKLGSMIILDKALSRVGSSSLL